MKKIIIPVLVIMVVAFTSCNETAYLSSLNSVSHTYHTYTIKFGGCKKVQLILMET